MSTPVLLCEICKKSVARWRCLNCKGPPLSTVAVCGSQCLEVHQTTCVPAPDPKTTAGLLELALKQEPFQSCSCPSAADRCRSCREHDELRDSIEKAIKLARRSAKCR